MDLSFTDQEIQQKAVELGLVADGEELPRNQRSRVVAALAQQQRPKADKPKAAKVASQIVVQPGGEITVDGEPFPWIVARERMEVVVDPHSVSSVRMTLLAESVQILKPAAPESETPA